MKSTNSNPLLCSTTRSDLIEIVHHGIVCCTELSPTDGSPKILCQIGDIDRLFYPRSAMKFIQILPLIESGAVDYYGFTERELSIMCASHNSEDSHLETVRSILSKIGLDENDLQCGGHTPISEEAAFKYVREGVPTPFRAHIYNNCSGKHAGFLALCKYFHHPIEGYLSPAHPIQKLIREAVCDVFKISDDELHAGVDGCSAPAFALSARQASYGFARLCSSFSSASPSFFSPIRQQAILKMISSITHYPDMVYGTNGFCTELMREFSGQVIGKRGAAGVYLSGVVRGSIGCAVKIDDGAMGPQYNVTMELLHWLWGQNKLQSCPSLLSSEQEENQASNGDDSSHGWPNKQEGKDLKQRFDNLERFRVTPSYNSMGLLVGHTRCVEGLFSSEEGSIQPVAERL